MSFVLNVERFTGRQLIRQHSNSVLILTGSVPAAARHIEQEAMGDAYKMDMQRRAIVAAAVAGAALLSSRTFAQSVNGGGKLIPWSDPSPPLPAPITKIVTNLQTYDGLGTWITPNDKFFGVGHYEYPTIDEKTWALDVAGSVANPTKLTLANPEGITTARSAEHDRMLGQ